MVWRAQTSPKHKEERSAKAASERFLSYATAYSILNGLAQYERVEIDEMASLIALGREIMHVLRRPTAKRTLIGNHIDVRAPQGCNLLGIVGHHHDTAHAKLAQHFGREIEPPLIEPEAENFIGIIRVIAIMLQTVSIDLVGQTVAAAFLIEIEQNPAAMLGHVLNRAAQLIAAIAFQRTEQIAG
jgi:hypothetical protein